MMDMVDFLGDGDDEKGYQLAMLVYALLALGCFVFCFMTTTERVTPPANERKTSMATDLKHLFSNNQFVIIALIAVAILFLVAMRGAVTPYYVEYYLEKPELVSEFLTSGMIASLLGALFTNFAAKKFEKTALFKFAAFMSFATHGVLYFLSAENIAYIFVVFAVANFFQMVMVPLMFSMVPDVSDYGQLKSGKNTMGMAFSAHLLAIKLGLALGAAVTGWLLGASGYLANQVQTEDALQGILWCFALLPSAIGVLLMALISFYRLNSETMETIHRQLADYYPRHAAAE